MLVPVMRDRIRAVRLWGLVVILAYWSSIVWLPYVLKPLGVPGKSRLLTWILEAYYWPPMRVLGFFTHLLPYPAFMFYGPYLAVALSAFLCSVLWWTALTGYLRHRARPTPA